MLEKMKVPVLLAPPGVAVTIKGVKVLAVLKALTTIQEISREKVAIKVLKEFYD